MLRSHNAARCNFSYKPMTQKAEYESNRQDFHAVCSLTILGKLNNNNGAQGILQSFPDVGRVGMHRLWVPQGSPDESFHVHFHASP